VSPSAEAADGDSVAGLARLQRAIQIAAKEAYPAFSKDAAFTAAIKGYLRGIDAYSTYISPEEVQALRAADSHEFVGVGMDIIQDHKGFLYCLPYAGSPAEQAGIGYGDILRTIDGVQVETLSLQSVKSRIRGKEGSALTLGIVDGKGWRESILKRRRITSPAVELLRDDTVARIRILSFDRHTMGELLAALTAIPAGSSLILDLRGNIGGDLEVATDCSGLFLPEGALIVSMQNKFGASRVLRAKAGIKAKVGSIVLWQDRFTASSAEVFCAALAQNKRGKTLGQVSFGKGVTQRVMPADDGGLYVITNAELLPPNGKPYDRKGLEPDLPIVQQPDSFQRDFLRRSHEVLSRKP
jgi:carboxyl-terminal processing protease